MRIKKSGIETEFSKLDDLLLNIYEQQKSKTNDAIQPLKMNQRFIAEETQPISMERQSEICNKSCKSGRYQVKEENPVETTLHIQSQYEKMNHEGFYIKAKSQETERQSGDTGNLDRNICVMLKFTELPKIRGITLTLIWMGFLGACFEVGG